MLLKPPERRIETFTGPHWFLSNFYPTPDLMFCGLRFATSEHAYQWAKMSTPEGAEVVRASPTPGMAKANGRRFPIHPDWNHRRIRAMDDVLAAKFDDPALRSMLLATGDAVLVEGNHWGDRFWGVCRDVGENHLGRLLMSLRGRLASSCS